MAWTFDEIFHTPWYAYRKGRFFAVNILSVNKDSTADVQSVDNKDKDSLERSVMLSALTPAKNLELLRADIVATQNAVLSAVDNAISDRDA